MKATVSELESWQKSISIEIPEEEIEDEFNKKLNKYKREVKLPGFRPGKVPANLIKSRFGKAIKAEVIDDLVNKSYQKACKDNKIIPISEPKITDLKADDENPVTFNVSFEVDPEIQITGYKKLKIAPAFAKIGSKDVDAAIIELQERMAKFEDLERTSEKGDFITFESLSVQVDGAEAHNFELPKGPVEIGKGSLAEFDQGLIGLTADQETEISLVFPKDYQNKEIANKKGDFKIKVKKVQEKIIPPIDEEFFKKLGNVPDEKAFRELMKKQLEAEEERRAWNEARNQAVEALIKNNDFAIPPSRIEYYLDRVVEQQAQYNQSGKTPDREEISKMFRDIGIKNLKQHRIIEYIAKEEKIKASQAEVDTHIELIAKQYNMPFEELKKTYRKDGTTMRIREEIKEQKVLDCLVGKIPWEKE